MTCFYLNMSTFLFRAVKETLWKVPDDWLRSVLYSVMFCPNKPVVRDACVIDIVGEISLFGLVLVRHRTLPGHAQVKPSSGTRSSG